MQKSRWTLLLHPRPWHPIRAFPGSSASVAADDFIGINPSRAMYHTVSRVNIGQAAHHLLAIVAPIAGTDAHLCEVCSCPWPPASSFDQRRDIARTFFPF